MGRFVSPRTTRPARLQPLAKLPIFFNLLGKKVLLAGGSSEAAWKAELLASCGAHIHLTSQDPSPEMLAIIQDKSLPGNITHLKRDWCKQDFKNATLAIADIEDPQAADLFRKTAHNHGVQVNIIDNPYYCDFQFGTIINRSPVVIGIMTDGAAPILGQALRRKIEALLPQHLSQWAAYAKAYRDRLAELLPDKKQRRQFWENWIDLLFSAKGEKIQLDQLYEKISSNIALEQGAKQGRVILVGAGPGDPELLTLKAMRALQSADVIVYDRLVTDEILELGRREAERIFVGKTGHGQTCQQRDINGLLIKLAQEGKTVIRLKGGDPAIFGRAGEEISSLEELGIEVSIIPGITTASAMACSVNKSLTHRDYSQRLQFITGHDKQGKLSKTFDITALADPKATTCIYMPKCQINTLANLLLEQGLDPLMPALVGVNIARPEQEIEAANVEQLTKIDFGNSDKPTLIMIGYALNPDFMREKQSATQTLEHV